MGSRWRKPESLGCLECSAGRRLSFYRPSRFRGPAPEALWIIVGTGATHRPCSLMLVRAKCKAANLSIDSSFV